jgi:tRNA uridine 5-carbamoylmethylation protein Kti12
MSHSKQCNSKPQPPCQPTPFHCAPATKAPLPEQQANVFNYPRWCSGNICAFHARAPGSTPGRGACIFWFFAQACHCLTGYFSFFCCCCFLLLFLFCCCCACSCCCCCNPSLPPSRIASSSSPSGWLACLLVVAHHDSPLVVMSYQVDTCLLVLIGLPGAGKSSVCAAIEQLAAGPLSSLLGVAPSSITVDTFSYDTLARHFESIDPNFMLNTWKAQRHSIYTHIAQSVIDTTTTTTTTTTLCDDKQHQRLRLLLIDDNMYYRSMRYVYYQLAQRLGLCYVQLHVACSVATCVTRDSCRTRSEGEQTIVGMSHKLQPPNGKYLWERNSLHFDNDLNDHDGAQQAPALLGTTRVVEHIILPLASIWQASTPPATPLPSAMHTSEFDRQQVLNSLQHQADLRARKVVSATLACYKQSAGRLLSNLSHVAIRLKANALQTLRGVSQGTSNRNTQSQCERERERERMCV